MTATLYGKGSGVLTYTWERNGVTIPGANSNTYTVLNSEIPDNDRATYTVTITEDGMPFTNLVTVQKIVSETNIYTLSTPEPQILRNIVDSETRFMPELFTIIQYDGSLNLLHKRFEFYIDGILLIEEFTDAIQWIESFNGSDVYYAVLNIPALLGATWDHYNEFIGSSFDVDKVYYEYNPTTQTYFQTTDTIPQSGKTYYTKDTSLQDLQDALNTSTF